MTENRHLVGWPVSRDLCRRAAARQKNINMKSDAWLSRLTQRLRDAGCDVVFRVAHPMYIEQDKDVFVLSIYQGYKKEDEIDVEKILSQLPPIFDMVKKDFQITGEPKHFLANDGRPI